MAAGYPIALSILFSAVLFLIDRNKQWPVFWRCVRRTAITLAVVFVLGVGWYSYGHYRVSTAPPTLPADFSNWDK